MVVFLPRCWKSLYLARSAVLNVSIVFSSDGLFINHGTPSRHAAKLSLAEDMICLGTSSIIFVAPLIAQQEQPDQEL